MSRVGRHLSLGAQRGLAPLRPFICYRAHTLVNPTVAVTLAAVVLNSHLEGQLRVNHLVNAHTAQFGKPSFYRLCLLGWNGLDNAKNLL